MVDNHGARRHSAPGPTEIARLPSLYEFNGEHIFPHQPADSTSRKGNRRLRRRYQHHVTLDKQAGGFLQAICDITEVVKSAALANGIREKAIWSVRGYEFEIDMVFGQR
jgi:hypothetical protein